jgi:hypothetical protein
MLTALLVKICWNWWLRYSRRTAQVSLLLLLVPASAIHAQSASPAAAPSAAAGSAEKTPPGFTPGWTGGVQFEGSTSSDGDVFDLSFGSGYNFTRHFGVGVDIPYYFIGTPSSIKTKNPTAVSGNGIGSVTASLRGNFPGEVLNYAPSLAVGAPTGDTKKGLSTGHATWNLGNHFDHGWGSFTPFVDAGVGNSVADTRYFHRPFATFGYNFASRGGTTYDAGPFTFTASAYDIAPWGDQTVFSRVFRCPKGTKCSASGTSTDRKGYKSASVLKGGASLTRDNGFNFGVGVNVHSYLDLEAGYTRSVPLGLNIFSFGVSLDVAALLHNPPNH